LWERRTEIKLRDLLSIKESKYSVAVTVRSNETISTAIQKLAETENDIQTP